MASRNTTLPLLACLLGLTGSGAAHAKGTRDSAALAAMSSFAAGRSGIVVWQSRRTGPLRIFACNLDGTNLRQLSPDVAGKDHIAPMISPDGTKVLYYETATLDSASYYNDHVGDMLVVDANDTTGSSAKLLVQQVRTFFECRFARWIDNDRIAYIGKDHHGYIYTLSTGASAKQYSAANSSFGAIPNRTLTHAIDGYNRVFEIKDPGPSGTLVQRQDYDGCEGNTSIDGLFAYRVAGSTHDFTRMKLGDWTEEVFFPNHDSALPADQGYIYFPQISPCQGFLVLGASPDQHDHFASDYDIFVVPIDPTSFKPTGSAVKYSFSDKLDSYPDIWVATESAPELVVTPAAVTFNAVTGGAAPPPQTVAVSNAGGGTLAAVESSVSYASDDGWLVATVSGDGNQQVLTNQVDLSDLASGTYVATVHLSSAGATNSPQQITVTLAVYDHAIPDGAAGAPDGGPAPGNGGVETTMTPSHPLVGSCQLGEGTGAPWPACLLLLLWLARRARRRRQ